MQHYHDIYCPLYKPNWNNKDEEKWYIIFNAGKMKYDYETTWIYCEPTVYFDSEEIVEKICEELNKSL